MQSDLNDEALAPNKAPTGWQKLFAVIQESLGLIKNLVELTSLELLVALQAIPKLMAIGFVLIFISALTWISLSVSLAWVAYKWVGDVGAGFICFFLVQLVTLVVLLLAFRHHLRVLALPNSRAQINNIAEVLRDTFSANKAEEAGRDK